mmetsp:Transcript_52518/g.151354  ORF Transcript_52518/g.151354 Transcript_52518/m.151354 type:complete len:340 (+) Transcript_52518:2-1021(+)
MVREKRRQVAEAPCASMVGVLGVALVAGATIAASKRHDAGLGGSSLAEDATRGQRVSPAVPWRLAAAARCMAAPYRWAESGQQPCLDCAACGEDAFFVARPTAVSASIGIADGVGGWADKGVSSADFAVGLMGKCSEVAESPVVGADPKRLLAEGYERLLAIDGGAPTGSSTACVLTLDRRSGMLKVANLGDSSALLIRSADLAVDLESEAQWHEFNLPYQLEGPENGFVNPHADQPDMADEYSAKVREGDLVILATDGVLDNLFRDEVLDLVREAPSADVGDIADTLVRRSWERSRSLQDTPFGIAARRAGHKHVGGKEDDITVVVGRVERDLQRPEK